MSLEGNKVLAAVLVAGTVFVGANVVNNAFIFTKHESGNEGAKHYPVPEIAQNNNGNTVPKIPEPIADISQQIINADLEAGVKIFSRQCSTCHKNNSEGAAHTTGPNLWQINGRDIASAQDFSYSKALEAKTGVWNNEQLNEFLYNPKRYAKGTKMSYRGLKDDQERANVIAYLNSFE